jgi:hypothetical protein
MLAQAVMAGELGLSMQGRSVAVVKQQTQR